MIYGIANNVWYNLPIRDCGRDLLKHVRRKSQISKARAYLGLIISQLHPPYLLKPAEGFSGRRYTKQQNTERKQHRWNMKQYYYLSCMQLNFFTKFFITTGDTNRLNSQRKSMQHGSVFRIIMLQFRAMHTRNHITKL